MTFGYDFSDTEEYGDFVTLTPGRYIFALTKAEKDESAAGNPMAVITLRVVAGNEAYIGGTIRQNWLTSGKSAFRLRAMMRALGIDLKDKGKVALEKYYEEEFGARVSLTEGKDKNEAGETIFFHDLNSILPAEQYADLLEDLDEEEEEDDEDIEDEDIEDIEDDEDEDDEEGISVEDLDDMDLAALKELAEEWEVSTKPDKGKKKLGVAQMRRRLTAVIEDAEEDEDEDEEEEDDDEGLTEDDLTDMGLASLREVAEENDVKLPKPKPGKKLSAARVRKVLVEALFDDEDEGDDEEPF